MDPVTGAALAKALYEADKKYDALDKGIAKLEAAGSKIKGYAKRIGGWLGIGGSDKPKPTVPIGKKRVTFKRFDGGAGFLPVSYPIDGLLEHMQKRAATDVPTALAYIDSIKARIPQLKAELQALTTEAGRLQRGL